MELFTDVVSQNGVVWCTWPGLAIRRLLERNAHSEWGARLSILLIEFYDDDDDTAWFGLTVLA